ncbi:MAG: lytic transglycosylase domain-containing protein [Bacteroidota bacterium]
MKKLALAVLPLGFACAGVTMAPTNSQVPSPHEDLRKMTHHLSAISQEPYSDFEFAGEQIPLADPQVKERLQRHVNRFLGRSYGNYILQKRMGRYKKNFQRILENYGIPKDFFYLSVTESALSNATSPVGAKGFWQFMPATARAYGLEVSSTIDERYHPEKATHAAARYLRRSYKDFGDWALVAAAYNMGPSGLRRQLKNQQKESYYKLKLNRETQNYFYKIMAYKLILDEPYQFGIQIDEEKIQKPLSYKSIYVRQNIDDLAIFAEQNQTDLRSLRNLNPWLISHQLIAKEGKTYEIRIPLNSSLRADELVVDDVLNKVSVPSIDAPNDSSQVESVANEPNTPPVEVAIIPDSTNQA